MKHTTFGVWDKEVKQLVKDVVKITEKSEEDISNWFYEQGVVVFQMAQARKYTEVVDASKAATGRRPVITGAYMNDAKIIGFEAMLDAVQNTFAQNHTQRETIEEYFRTFIDDVVPKYQKFYDLQARITTELNHALDEFDAKQVLNQNPTPIHPIKFVHNSLEKFIEEHTTKDDAELVLQVREYLLFMKEFIANMANAAATKAKADMAAASKTEATTPEAITSLSPKPLLAAGSIAPLAAFHRDASSATPAEAATLIANKASLTDEELEIKVERLQIRKQSS